MLLSLGPRCRVKRDAFESLRVGLTDLSMMDDDHMHYVGSTLGFIAYSSIINHLKHRAGIESGSRCIIYGEWIAASLNPWKGRKSLCLRNLPQLELVVLKQLKPLCSREISEFKQLF